MTQMCLPKSYTKRNLKIMHKYFALSGCSACALQDMQQEDYSYLVFWVIYISLEISKQPCLHT